MAAVGVSIGKNTKNARTGEHELKGDPSHPFSRCGAGSMGRAGAGPRALQLSFARAIALAVSLCRPGGGAARGVACAWAPPGAPLLPLRDPALVAHGRPAQRRGAWRGTSPPQPAAADRLGARSVATCLSMRGGDAGAAGERSTKAIARVRAARARVYVISDLHADYKPNMEWIKSLPSRREDAGAACLSVLLIAGDLASDLDTLEEGLLALTSKFDEVATRQRPVLRSDNSSDSRVRARAGDVRGGQPRAVVPGRRRRETARLDGEAAAGRRRLRPPSRAHAAPDCGARGGAAAACAAAIALMVS